MTDRQETYHLQLESHDALLYQALSDGTLRMRAITLEDLDRRVSRIGARGPISDHEIVRRTLLEVLEEENAELAGMPDRR